MYPNATRALDVSQYQKRKEGGPLILLEALICFCFDIPSCEVFNTEWINHRQDLLKYPIYFVILIIIEKSNFQWIIKKGVLGKRIGAMRSDTTGNEVE